MDTRRTMIAPKAACMAGSLALLLTTAIPVMVFPNAADAQVRQTQARQTQASASARTSSARRANSPTRRAASQTRRTATPARAVSPSGNDGATSPASGPAAIRAANAEALAPSRADGFVNAAQVFSFEQGRVYEVWTAPMRITALTLEPGERIINKAAGDTERWMIGDTTSGEGNAQQSQILIKPLSGRYRHQYGDCDQPAHVSLGAKRIRRKRSVQCSGLVDAPTATGFPKPSGSGVCRDSLKA